MAQELRDTSLYADANLKAYYRFESGALTTDSSGNGYTLTNNNSVAEGTGKFGGGADLGSSNTTKYLSIADSFGIDGGACSYSMWFKPNVEISSGDWYLFYKSNNTSKVLFSALYQYNSGTRRLQFNRTNLGGTQGQINYNVTLGTSWNHIVLTYDATNLIAYLNGNQIGIVAHSGTGSGTVETDFEIGGAFTGSTLYSPASATFDDFSIFGRALTLAEIQNLYDRGIKKINGVYMGSQEIASTRFATDANLRAYYKFNTGALTTDSSGNGYTLTNNNTVADGTGKFGGGADFGTSNSNKSLTRADALGTSQNEDKTISLWVKMNTELSGGDTYKTLSQLVYNANDLNFSIGYYRVSSVNYVVASCGRVNVAAYEATKAYSLGTSSWHHIVMTYTTSTAVVRGYLDGDYFGQATKGAGDGAGITSDAFGINVNFADCIIDDVGVYNRVFTSDEIYSLYKTGVKKLNGQVNLNPELESTSLRGDANLVEYLRLEGNSTATVGSNGTDTDMTYGATYGKFGQGGLFNGTSSKIVTGNCNIGTRFTVSIWIKADGNQILYSRVIENDYANGGFAISAKSTTTWDAGVNGTTLTTFPPIKSGVWNHLALVYNGASITLYSDGVPYSVASTTDPTQTNIPLYIGEYVGGGNYYFKGSMDDLAIFSRALTAQEISNLYNTNIKKYNQVSNV